jgi:hypothetical protein
VNREAQFKTLKYRPDFPIKVLQPTFTPALLNGNPKSFKDLEAERVNDFAPLDVMNLLCRTES